MAQVDRQLRPVWRAGTHPELTGLELSDGTLLAVRSERNSSAAGVVAVPVRGRERDESAEQNARPAGDGHGQG